MESGLKINLSPEKTRLLSGAISLLSVFVIIGSIYLNSILLGSVSLIVYFFSTGFFAGLFILKKGRVVEQLFWGVLSLFLFFLLLNTAIYYLYGMKAAVSCILLLSPLPLYYKKPISGLRCSILLPTLKIKILLLILAYALLEAALLVMMYVNRSYETMPSPWQNLTSTFFVLYAVATLVLFFIGFAAKSSLSRVLLSMPHIFITYAVAAIMYPLGYGFDGIVHRATETWIAANGSISPKNPFYIGQYSMVVWLHQITRVSIHFLDIFFVPILASLTMPGAIIYALKKVWNIPTQIGMQALWLAPCLYFLSLHLTTPHNLVLLFSLLLIFSLFLYDQGHLPALIPLLISAASLATHPLLGVPLALLSIACILIKTVARTRMQKILKYALPVAIALTPVSLFTAYLFVTRHTLPSFSNPFEQLSYFINLFSQPYWIATDGPTVFLLLYRWQRLIVPVILAFGVFGYIFHSKKISQRSSYLLAAFGLWIGAWLLRSWVVFPDVPISEQGDYPLRLLRTGVFFLLPFAMAFYSFSFTGRWKKRIIPFALVGAITLSFYLSYPQYNSVAKFPGYNITKSDLKAVEIIHNENKTYNYIVLSNPVVAAAALERYSFARYFDTNSGPVFYYSIPAGGVLYKAYTDMVYDGQKRETVDAAMDLSGVKKAYFIMNDYWKDYDKIVASAKTTADRAISVDNGKLWILFYERDR